MKSEIDLSTYFKMDKTYGKVIHSDEEWEKENAFWLDRPIEERYYAIEFLRAQWLEFNHLPTIMDRSFFEYR